jgi:hypothetical protein
MAFAKELTIIREGTPSLAYVKIFQSGKGCVPLLSPVRF